MSRMAESRPPGVSICRMIRRALRLPACSSARRKKWLVAGPIASRISSNNAVPFCAVAAGFSSAVASAAPVSATQTIAAARNASHECLRWMRMRPPSDRLGGSPWSPADDTRVIGLQALWEAAVRTCLQRSHHKWALTNEQRCARRSRHVSRERRQPLRRDDGIPG